MPGNLVDRGGSFSSLQVRRPLLDMAVEMFPIKVDQCMSKMNAGVELRNMLGWAKCSMWQTQGA
jgi:hypothetical protein